MANMQNYKTPDRVREPSVRNKDFLEVSLGYTKEDAINEATRCLNCKNSPCVNGCPVGIEIPKFIQKVTQGDFEGAYQIISEKSCLSAVCGRVCPQENQCESKCIRGIKGEPVGIGRLERFVADYHYSSQQNVAQPKGQKTGKKVAVIGSGPAGLSCAGQLNSLGYSVTVFEALHQTGGVLVYGIPEFRLPKEIVDREVQSLKDKGVEFVTNTVIGKTLTIEELQQNYNAIFIGSGAGLPKFMGIKGENLGGVYSANEFLTRINLMKAYKEDSKTPVLRGKKVAVVGGGNVAMDSVRCAMRLGAKEVYLVYRRSEKELPARHEEVLHAKEEGVIFKVLTNPVEILEGENFMVKGIKVIQMQLGEPDERGRRTPIEIPGSEYVIDCDVVIMALGTTPNPLIKNNTKMLEVNGKGCIIADNQGQTNLQGVFAGGDAVTGSATVILAMGAGKTAANAIDEYLKKV